MSTSNVNGPNVHYQSHITIQSFVKVLDNDLSWSTSDRFTNSEPIWDSDIDNYLLNRQLQGKIDLTNNKGLLKITHKEFYRVDETKDSWEN